MKNAMLRTLIGAALFSLISIVVVSIIGLRLGWKTPNQFSDGFFWAGVIMFAGGLASSRGYSQRTTTWPPVHLDPSDGARLWVADAFRGKILMAVFGISGSLMFGLSALASRLF